MAIEPEDGGGGFIERLVQGAVEHAAPQPRPKADFKQWHKPRKHWIRKNQWEAEAMALIQLLNLQGKGRPLSYISLPGPDMLDVRTMHSACQRSGVGLRFLGFMSGDTADKTELNISLDEVMGLSGVTGDSSVVTDPLQSLADAKSVGFARALTASPFDIVNIDLCKSIGNAPPLDEQRGCYDALQKIIGLQLRKRPAEEPWILFLTTRANHETVHEGARERFFECLLGNARDHAEVDTAIRECLALDQAALSMLREGQAGADVAFEPAFAAAISKWLLLLLGRAEPAGTLELLPSSCVYGIRGPGLQDMLSLGFLCRTRITPPNDPAGLAHPEQVPAAEAFPTEPQAAAAIIRYVPLMRNVDDILCADNDVYARISAEAAEFMRAARFDHDSYLEWAAKQREAPTQQQALG